MPYRLLFPLATLFAIIAIPLWLAFRAMSPASVVDAAWHGHEMLFGYAFAVIAGFLATRTTPTVAWLLAGTWLAARIAAASGGGLIAFIAGLAFPLTLLFVTTPQLFRAAKRRENKILPLLLTALVAANLAGWSGLAGFGPQLKNVALLVAIDLVALLLLLIGGRALRAAIGGHIERQGIERRDRLQPRYELPLAILVGSAAVFDTFSYESLAGTVCIGAAVLTLMRVIPWQLHYSLSRPAVWSLALGYLWLVAGLAVKGIAQLGGYIPVTEMIHGIGIGALGTLTLVMMARTAMLRTRKPITGFRDIGSAALLISAAALARLAAPFVPVAQHGLLWFAAITWSCAFLILLARLWRTLLSAGNSNKGVGVI